MYPYFCRPAAGVAVVVAAADTQVQAVARSLALSVWPACTSSLPSMQDAHLP